MIRLTGPEDCRARFGILTHWFGPPPIWTTVNREDVLIDGRLRCQEYGGNHPVGIVAATPREIVRTLCAAGEYERARDYVPANITRPMIASWAAIPSEWVACMAVTPKAPRTVEGSLDRVEVVRRCRRLLDVAEAGERVTAEDLRWALGRFAGYCRKVKR